MSQFLAEGEEDPRNIFYKEALEVKVSEQLKPKIPFEIVDLAQKGQNTLLDISEKLGAMFFAFGPELIVLPNSQLNQVLSTGKLDVNRISAQGGSNRTDESPIIFLKAFDSINTLFLQHQGSEELLIADLN